MPWPPCAGSPSGGRGGHVDISCIRGPRVWCLSLRRGFLDERCEAASIQGTDDPPREPPPHICASKLFPRRLRLPRLVVMEVSSCQAFEMSWSQSSCPHSNKGVCLRKECLHEADVRRWVLRRPRLEGPIAGWVFGSHLHLDLGVARGCAAQSFQYSESSSELAFPDEVEALVEMIFLVAFLALSKPSRKTPFGAGPWRCQG